VACAEQSAKDVIIEILVGEPAQHGATAVAVPTIGRESPPGASGIRSMP
jgi:hypothetical protein